MNREVLRRIDDDDIAIEKRETLAQRVAVLEKRLAELTNAMGEAADTLGSHREILSDLQREVGLT